VEVMVAVLLSICDHEKSYSISANSTEKWASEMALAAIPGSGLSRSNGPSYGEEFV